MSLQKRVARAVEKGVLWLKAQQKTDGGYGRWGTGSTGFAAMALLACGLPASAPAVTGAADYILNCRPADSTHFRALTVMALLAARLQEPDVLRRVQTDTDWLITAQNDDPGDWPSYGGWGQGAGARASDGSNTQFALMALREAAARSLAVPPETWRRAVAWYQRGHAVNQDGSFVHSPGDHAHNREAGAVPALTAGALCGLVAVGLHSPDREVRLQARSLADRASDWLGVNHAAGPGSPTPDGWYFLYLFSLGPGGAFKAAPPVVGGRSWRDEAADYLVGCQEPDGRWLGAGEKTSTEVIYTSLALLTLNAVMPEYQG